MQKETINVNGKRLNKLEEIVRLLQKLNEDYYSEEERKEFGYPVKIELLADGSGSITQPNYPYSLYKFGNLVELDRFLRGTRRQQHEEIFSLGLTAGMQHSKEKK